MNLDELKTMLVGVPVRKRVAIVKQNAEAINLLEQTYPNVKLNFQIYSLMNNKSPYCKVCNSTLTDVRKNTCSYQCREKIIDHAARVKSQKITLEKKYGVSNIRQVPGAEEKRKKTLIESYGSLASPRAIAKAKDRVNNLLEKGRETLKRKYGVTNPGQLPGHYEKCMKTHIANTGYSHFSKTEKFKLESEQKKLENYISMCPSTVVITQINRPNEILQTNFTFPNDRIEFECRVCNTTEIIPTETFKFRLRSAGTCCKVCGGLNSGSIQETELKKFISDELMQVIISNDRTTIKPLEIDILIADKKIGIEYNGLYWHNLSFN